MQRYFVDPLTSDLYQDDIFHITKVMRLKVEDKFELVKNSKVYIAKIISLNPFKYNIMQEVNENHELNGYLRLFYCIPKGEKINLVIQKAVELGVNEIVLINSMRSIAKINESNKKAKLERFNKIIKEASEQSKRTNLTKLTKIITFKELSRFSGDFNLICYEKSKFSYSDLVEIFSSLKNKTVNVIVGAEGGIDESELKIATENNFQAISLGNRILRSETACLYILSLISFYMN